MHDQWQNADPQSIQQAMRFAGTPEGQQLLRILQQNGGDALQKAMEKAAAGDMTQAKQTLSALLQNEEAQKLLKQLGR
jgi:thioredoxin-like negative regulator of GroEL